MPHIDLTGKQFGKWEVLEFSHIHNTNSYWNCKCDCGKEKTVCGYNLRKGISKSCGCGVKIHGKSNTKLFYIWTDIHTRCDNKNHKDYPYYGGRGIKMCDSWSKDFQSFYDWAMDNGYEKGLTIERIEVNDGYNPDNCKWATRKEQGNNKRNNIYFIVNGNKLSAKQLCNKYEVNYNTFLRRFHENRDFKELFEKSLEIHKI